MYIIRNIKDKTGFSIAELLVAILILSMVSTVVAGGIPVARDAYNKITVAANAQVLLSTTINSLRSELGTAPVFLKIGDDKKIVYKSSSRESKSMIDYSGESIMICDYYDTDDNHSSSLRELSHGTDDLYISCGNISLSGNLITIENLEVKQRNTNQTFGVKPMKLLIHTIGVLETDSAEG